MIDPRSTTVLVLGASGMLGNAVLRLFARSPQHSVMGSVRSGGALAMLSPALRPLVVSGVDVENFDSLTALFAQARPHVVVNCVGLVKQLAEASGTWFRDVRSPSHTARPLASFHSPQGLLDLLLAGRGERRPGSAGLRAG